MNIPTPFVRTIIPRFLKELPTFKMFIYVGTIFLLNQLVPILCHDTIIHIITFNCILYINDILPAKFSLETILICSFLVTFLCLVKQYNFLELITEHLFILTRWTNLHSYLTQVCNNTCNICLPVVRPFMSCSIKGLFEVGRRYSLPLLPVKTRYSLCSHLGGQLPLFFDRYEGSNNSCS